MLHPQRRRLFGKDLAGFKRKESQRRLAFEQFEARRLLAAISWSAASGGSWHVASNWSLGRVPAAGDDVTIPNLTGNQTIEFSTGTTNIASLSSQEAVTLSGGSLIVSGSLAVTQGLTLRGGSLSNATVSASTTIIGTANGGTLTNINTLGPLDFSQQANANAMIFGGLNANNQILLGNASGTTYGRLYFGNVSSASGSLTGSATVIMGGSDANFIENRSNLAGASGTFTIGSGITIRGHSGHVYSVYTNGALINQGTINVDTAGGTIYLGYSSTTGTFTNTGTINVSAGTLSLNGVMTLAGLGTINRSGGNIQLSGTLELQTNSWTLNAATGSWNLLGGSIRNGEIVQAGGAQLVFTRFGGTFSNITTVSGGLDLSRDNNVNLRIFGGVAVNGNILLGNAAGSTYGRLYFGDSVSAPGALTGTATVVMGGSDANVIENSSNLTGASGTFTIGAGVTIRGKSGYIYSNFANGSLVNQGTINADTSGGILFIGNASTTGTFTNTGTINVSLGTLYFDAAMTLAGLGTISRTGGTIGLRGTLDLQGNTWNLNSTTGTWQIVGGTVQNGSISQTGTAQLLPTRSGGRLINTASISGGLDLSQDANVNLRIYGGLNISGNVLLGNAAGTTSGRLFFADPASMPGTLTGNVTVVMGGSESNYLENSSNLTGAAGTLTIGPTVTIRGKSGYIYNNFPNGSIVNQGTMNIDTAGGALFVGFVGTPGTFTNTGTINVSAGNLYFDANLTHAGLGTINRTGGTINLRGTLNLQNNNWQLNAATGSWTLAGGTIQNGSISQTGGAQLIPTTAGGRFIDIANVSGGLDLSQNGITFIRVYGGLNINGTVLLGNAAGTTAGRLFFADPSSVAGSITGNATFVMGGSESNYIENSSNLTGAAGTLTIGPTVTIRGRSGYIYNNYPNGSIVNQGTMNIDTSGGRLFVGFVGTPGTFTNAGTVNVSAGELFLDANMTFAGLGTINRTGGTINLRGSLDLQNNNWQLNAATGSWNLAGGTVSNGSISQSGGAQLVMTLHGGRLLNISTVNGGLDLSRDTNVTLRVLGGIDVNGTVLLGNAAGTTNGRLLFADASTSPRTFGGNATVLLGGSTNNYVENSSNLTGLDGRLTIGPNVIVRGKSGRIANLSASGSLLNQGTLGPDVAAGTLTVDTIGSFSNTGNLAASNGATLRLPGILTINDQNSLFVSSTSSLFVGGSLLSTTADKPRYQPSGSLTFNGGGTAAAPMRLETVSRDLGAIANAFFDTLTFGSISLANNTYLRLVDDFDHAPGADAIYTNSLTVPAGSTLDLNNLKIYTRAYQRIGSVINGTVIVVPPDTPTFSDLVVTDISLPNNIQSGQEITIHWSEKNDGPVAISGSWSTRVRLVNSTTSTVIYDQTFNYSGNLIQPGNSLPRSVTTILPNGNPGTGQFEVAITVDTNNQVTEFNLNGTGEANNLTSFTFNSTLAPYPELSVTAITVPPTLVLNQPFTISWTVTNNGTGPLVRNTIDGIYLSIDNQPGNPLITLATSESSSQLPLAAGASYTRTSTLTLPLTPALAGSPRYIFVVADQFNAQFEMNESNNFSSRPVAVEMPPLPDLKVASISSQRLAVAGQSIPISWTIENTGQAPASGQWHDEVYLSPDETTGNDIYLGTFPVTATIGAGASIDRRQSIRIPAGLAGDYRLVVITNLNGEVIESDNTNNITMHNQWLTIDPRPSANLIVGQVTSLTTGLFSGQAANVEWTVTNIGNASTNSSGWEDRIYLSDDTTLSPDDLFLGRAANFSFLNPDDSYRNSLSITLPENAAGDRYFIVQTDAWDQVPETAGEQDNTRASALARIQLTPPADLVVSAVSVARDGIAGEPTPITWTVKNQGTGPTRVTSWVDQVYLSTNGRDIDPTDVLLANVPRSAALNVGQEYQVQSLSVTLPPDRITNQAFIIVRTDGTNRVYEDAFEGNNDTAAEFPINIVAPPQPDLIVQQVDMSSEASAGQPLRVSYTLINESPIDTRQGTWRDTVYLSEDRTLDPQTDLAIGSRQHFGGLAGLISERVGVDLRLPDTLAGTFYVLVATDSGLQVTEASDDNNVGASPNTVTVTINPPDLQVTSLLTSGTPAAARELTVTYTVVNSGGNPTPVDAWSDAIYLSVDDQLDSADLLLSQRVRVGTLPAGASESRSVNVTLPSDHIGSFYLFVHSDSRHEIYELNNANNIGRTPLTIIDNRPDLSVTAFQPRLGSRKLLPGATVALDYEVTNRGLGPTAGATWTDSIVLSADTIAGNSDDIVLSSYTNSHSLSIGQSYSRLSQTVGLPRNISEGPYRLFLMTDTRGQVSETDETNNVLASLEFTITNSPGVGSPQADLVITTLGNPALLDSGNNLHINWTVTNLGNRSTAANFWYDDLWLSQDDAIDSQDIYIGRFLHESILAPGGSYSRNIDFRTDIDLQGVYYVIAKTDATNRVIEGDGEANNVRVSSATTVTRSPTPDLQITSLTPPTDAVAGRSFSIQWTTANIGGATAVAPWIDQFYLSLDQIFDPTIDVPIGFFEQASSLASNASVPRQAPFQIPVGVGGAFYVIGVSDSTRRVYERGGEGNNVTVSTTPVNIAHLPPADLVVGNITIPVNGFSGQSATINFTVTNNSTSTARGGWFDAVYLSSDDQWDIDDAYIGRTQRTGDVPGGQSYTASLTAPLPGVLPGNYRVIIRSDIRNAVPESDELNNLRATLNSVLMDAKALTLGIADSGSIATGGAVYYKVDVPAGESIAIELDSAATQGAVELYASFGTMPRRTQADHVAQEPYQADQRIVISSTEGGTYYILAYAQNVDSSPSSYTIRARILPFTVFDTDYGQGGTAGMRTLQINGARFDRSVTAELVDAQGQTIPAVRHYYTSDLRLYATFDLTLVERGRYSLRLNKASSQETLNVPNSLQVVYSTLSAQPLSLTRPDTFNRLRDDRPPAIIPVALGWRNSTLNDLPVPLIHFSATDPFARSFEDAKAGNTLHSTEFLGFGNSDGPRDILLSGESATVNFFIKPLQVTAATPPLDIHYVAEYFYEAGSAFYPWNFDLSQLDLSYLSDDEAVAAIDAFQQSYGSSVAAYRQALVEALQRSGDLTPREILPATTYLLQNVFDRLVASRTTSIVGQLSWLNLNVDYEQLVVTLTEINGPRTFSTKVWQDGSFVLANLPSTIFAVHVTGGPVKAADGLSISLSAGQAVRLSIPLVVATYSDPASVPTAVPVGVSPVTAPVITLATRVDQPLAGNVLDEVLAQLIGQSYRVELVADAPVGFSLNSDGSYRYSASETEAFVVHYDLILRDTQSRVARLWNSEIRSRGALAITTKANATRDLRAVDPNDIIGPKGYSEDKKWVSANERLPYMIRFENDPRQASSAAQLVIIEQTLDGDLNPASVELGNFAFGGREFIVPPKRQSLNYDLDLRTELGIIVRVFATVDPASGRIRWTFSSISPATGAETTNPSEGFLPLNETPPEGDGWVSYTVKARSTAPSGAIIHAGARIIFDGNEPIDTPVIFNTLDATSPSSTVAFNRRDDDQSRLTVAWAGQDGEVGSGLARYDVYLSENGGAFRVWLKDTTLSEAELLAMDDTTYEFRTIAYDNVGNAEDNKKIPDSIRPIARSGGPYQATEGVPVTLSATATDPNGAIANFVYEWDLDYRAGESFQVDTTSATPQITLPAGPLTRSIGVRVRGTAVDAVNSLVSITTIEVVNAAPTLTQQFTTLTALINAPLVNSGTWSDVAGDDVALSASLGSVLLNTDGTWNWSFTSLIPRDQELVTITASDKDGGTRSISFTISSSFSSETFTPALSAAFPAWTAQALTTLALDFSSSVFDFSAEDVQLSNASLLALRDLGNGRYELDVQAAAPGTVTAQVASSSVYDQQARLNTASTILTWTYVDVSNMDFGDAPGSTTLLADNGPRHRISSLRLGQLVDADTDGVPSPLADGDDVSNPVGADSDEDGINMLFTLVSDPLLATTSSFIATASGPGKLDAWIDFNQDGDWDDMGEQIASSVDVTAGANLFSFVIPAGSRTGQSYARFRLSSQGQLGPVGEASDGEVEDYAVTINSSSVGMPTIFTTAQVAAHTVDIVSDQLRVLVGTRVVWQVPARAVDSFRYIDAADASQIYQVTNPVTNLFGSLTFVTLDQSLVIRTERAVIDLNSLSGQVQGVDRIELTSTATQQLIFSVSTVRTFNSRGSLLVQSGVGDQLITTGWKYDVTARNETSLVQSFVASGATLQLAHALAWHNPLSAMDVNGDGLITPIDALLIINQINLGSRLPEFDPIQPRNFFFPDTSGDNVLSPRDALLVINELNRRAAGGEGEQPAAEHVDAVFDQWEHHLAPPIGPRKPTVPSPVDEFEV